MTEPIDYHHRGGVVERQLQSVEFLGDAVVVTYSTVPDDIRETGLTLTHNLVIPLDQGDYEDEYTAAYEAVQTLVNDALEDMSRLEPYDPREQPDEERDPDADDED